LDANKNGIRKLYKKLTDPMTGKVPKKKIINLLTNETKIILDEKDANTCYNLSLQTC